MVLGAVLNPVPSGRVNGTLQAVAQADGRWLAMAVVYFAASVLLTLGPAGSAVAVRPREAWPMPRDRRDRCLLGRDCGLAGLAMLMVFIRTPVVEDLKSAARSR